MKLKFTIEYGTRWGETLHVVLCYLSKDGTRRQTDLLMQTADGLNWVVETAAVESRQHPISAISYHYQVVGGEGRVMRTEWHQVERTYWFDSSRNYVFNDQWRDLPLCAHLYSNAYLTTQHAPHGEQVEARRVPLYRRTVVFRVAAPQLTRGQALALIGSHPMMGGWNPARYLKMEYIGQHDWLLAVNMDAVPLPVEYKYVVIDTQTHELLAWEEGDNRTIGTDAAEGAESDGRTVGARIAEGEVRVLYGGLLRMKEKTWRAAGVVVPVFSLRSDHSYGCGDFGDLRHLVDWAVTTGMKVIQLLPVNDTTTDGQWHDSHPYNITSCFALHPHYLDLEQLGELKDRQKMTAYRRRQRELNALSYSDYEAVGRVKGDYVSDSFAERGQQVLASKDYKTWYDANATWLEPYAAWRLTQQQPAPQLTASQSTQQSGAQLIYYVQYLLHLQLKAAADYARQQGVVLKGDVPIGVYRHSVETATHPELFNLDCQAGTPPDNATPLGHNWGFPTYQWKSEAKTGSLTVDEWFGRRFKWMEQYFDAVRIDHVLAFFRIWEIPADAVHSLLGHFSPALPFTPDEIEYFGLSFRKEAFTKPYINDRVLERLFGMHAQYVRDTFLTAKAYGLYDLKADYATQRQVMVHFEGRGDENSLWIRDGLLRLIANVLFVEDPRQPEMYHPRILAYQETVYDALSMEEKDAYLRLYNNYYYQRHSMFWGSEAMRRLDALQHHTRMLICAEDLGMLPDCVAPVLDAQRILTLEVQTLPKQTGFEFSHLDGYPYRSVATITTHDMAPLRLWWEENPERTQRYWVTMLQKEGRAPEHLPAHIAEEIIARHMYCPSMLCLLSLQDWLAMDSELRSKQPRQERINTPSDAYNRWQYRMHLTIEQLMKADRYNQKLLTMINRSKRGG